MYSELWKSLHQQVDLFGGHDKSSKVSSSSSNNDVSRSTAGQSAHDQDKEELLAIIQRLTQEKTGSYKLAVIISTSSDRLLT